jgi:hypothetical protein
MGAALDRAPWPERLAVLVVCGLIFLASLVMVAIPFAWLWLLSNLSLAYVEIYFLALLGCPTLIVCWCWVLVRLNRIYYGLARDPRPVLEVSITLAVLIAVAGLVGWWAFLADAPNPSGPLQPI